MFSRRRVSGTEAPAASSAMGSRVWKYSNSFSAPSPRTDVGRLASSVGQEPQTHTHTHKTNNVCFALLLFSLQNSSHFRELYSTILRARYTQPSEPCLPGENVNKVVHLAVPLHHVGKLLHKRTDAESKQGIESTKNEKQRSLNDSQGLRSDGHIPSPG